MDGGWSPVFLRPFNDWELEEVERFLQFLHNKKIRPSQEDRLLLKESITDGFSVRLMYSKLVYSPPLDFPYRSIWNPIFFLIGKKAIYKIRRARGAQRLHEKKTKTSLSPIPHPSQKLHQRIKIINNIHLSPRPQRKQKK